MSLMNWQDDYSVGVKEIDDQHKKMFDLINRLYESIKESKDRKLREEFLQELSNYGKFHLKTEEDYFEKFKYPQKEEHVKIHDLYRNKIKEFVNKKDDIFLSFEIIDYLEDWWLEHITSVDKDYQDFFNKKGLE